MGRRAALVRDPCEQSSAQLALLIPNAKSSTRLLVDVEYPQGLIFTAASFHDILLSPVY